MPEIPAVPSADPSTVSLRQQAALAGFGAAALRGVDTESMLGEAARILADALSLDHVRILILQPDGIAFRVAARAGAAPRGPGIGSVGACSSAVRVLGLDRPPVLQEGDGGQDPLDCAVPGLACMRIRTGETPAGLLEAGSASGRSFTADELGFLAALADLVAAAIERQHLDQQVRQAMEHHAAEAAASTMMMREVQHRMKNNLQVINSLINLQGRRSNNPEIAHELDGLAHRIEALRLIHEKLYAHAPAGMIYLASYARELCTNLVEFIGESLDSPILEIEIAANLAVNTDTAIPFGLLLNEFVSQSLKSVLKGGHVAIRVGIAPLEQGQLRLGLRAEGHGDAVGVPQTGFGRQLIEMMASQLDGRLSWASARDLELTFPLS